MLTPEHCSHKCFWDRSLETKTRSDTYRYRVLDSAASEATLGDELDPEDDTKKIKILCVSLGFKDHSEHTPKTLLHNPSLSD